jgi:hypothetical protein
MVDMRRIACLLAVIGLAGCITPSIPIPPPDPTQMRFAIDTTAEEAVFEYPPTSNFENGVVFIYNRDRGVGIIEAAREDGSVGPTVPVPALAGEQISVTFELEEYAVSTCVRVREGAQDPTAYCDI